MMNFDLSKRASFPFLPRRADWQSEIADWDLYFSEQIGNCILTSILEPVFKRLLIHVPQLDPQLDDCAQQDTSAEACHTLACVAVLEGQRLRLRLQQPLTVR